MKIGKLFGSAFSTQEQALERLEEVRWRGNPSCPYCLANDVGRHASSDRKHLRWQCRMCKRPFAVTVGTIFHGTHIPLRDWFAVVALMFRSDDALSSYQIAEDLGIRRATVWRMMSRIRSAIDENGEQYRLLRALADTDKKDGKKQKARGAAKQRSTKKPPSHKVNQRASAGYYGGALAMLVGA